MATIAEIANLVNCGIGADLGTGDKGCQSKLEATTSIWYTQRGFKFDSTKDLTTNSDYVKQLQAEGKLIVLKGVKEFTVNKEEDVTETDPDGTIRVVRKGKYAFNAMFKKGFNYQSALSSLSSFGVYDTLFVDANGNILATTSEDKSMKGITTGMVEDTGIGFATFTTAMTQGLNFQFLDGSEIETDYFFISGKELSWKPQNIDGVNQVALEFTAIPADAATSITVKAKLRQGGSALTGLAFGDFLLTVNGATSNPTALTENPDGTYALTVSALSTNDVLSISIYDTAENRQAITLDTDLFKSNTATATVVA